MKLYFFRLQRWGCAVEFDKCKLSHNFANCESSQNNEVNFQPIGYKPCGKFSRLEIQMKFVVVTNPTVNNRQGIIRKEQRIP